MNRNMLFESPKGAKLVPDSSYRAVIYDTVDSKTFTEAIDTGIFSFLLLVSWLPQYFILHPYIRKSNAVEGNVSQSSFQSTVCNSMGQVCFFFRN
jgi:hypothetical protein